MADGAAGVSGESSEKRQRTNVVDCCVCLTEQGLAGTGIMKDTCPNNHPNEYLCGVCHRDIMDRFWWNQKCPLCRAEWGTRPTVTEFVEVAGSTVGGEPALLSAMLMVFGVIFFVILILEAGQPSHSQPLANRLATLICMLFLLFLFVASIFGVAGYAVFYYFGWRSCLWMAGYYLAVKIMVQLFCQFIWQPCRRRFRATPV